MNIVWRPMADADRENIFDYIAQDNPQAALELDEDFKAKVEIAALNLRSHLERLARKTICFSKSEEMHDKIIG
ncbi:hypothetical protein CYD30_26780 [Kosakonia cowanii]|nr:hypothetical protein CYD30_26780 [Kosakonia cowanii]